MSGFAMLTKAADDEEDLASRARTRVAELKAEVAIWERSVQTHTEAAKQYRKDASVLAQTLKE